MNTSGTWVTYYAGPELHRLEHDVTAEYDRHLRMDVAEGFLDSECGFCVE